VVELTLLLDRSSTLSGEVAECVFVRDGLDDRAMAVMAMRDIAFEHGQAILLLVASGSLTSGFALLRLQFEALLRSAWLLYVASNDQIAKLHTQLTPESQEVAKNLRSVGDMLSDLERSDAPGAGRLLRRFRDRNWGPLNSFVHGGIHPFRRTVDGYPLKMVIDLVKNSNGVSMLTLPILAHLFRDEFVGLHLHVLGERYADCLPDMEPFADQ
jgi:hypothetical protein